jgi:hypothetical protein
MICEFANYASAYLIVIYYRHDATFDTVDPHYRSRVTMNLFVVYPSDLN